MPKVRSKDGAEGWIVGETSQSRYGVMSVTNVSSVLNVTIAVIGCPITVIYGTLCRHHCNRCPLGKEVENDLTWLRASNPSLTSG